MGNTDLFDRQVQTRRELLRPREQICRMVGGARLGGKRGSTAQQQLLARIVANQAGDPGNLTLPVRGIVTDR